jgi:hypothetical protein
MTSGEQQDGVAINAPREQPSAGGVRAAAVAMSVTLRTAVGVVVTTLCPPVQLRHTCKHVKVPVRSREGPRDAHQWAAGTQGQAAKWANGPCTAARHTLPEPSSRRVHGGGGVPAMTGWIAAASQDRRLPGPQCVVSSLSNGSIVLHRRVG